jgi:hypothetical protein
MAVQCAMVDDEGRCLEYRERFGFPASDNTLLDSWVETPCANCKVGRDRARKVADERPPSCARCHKPIPKSSRSRPGGKVKESPYCLSCGTYVARAKKN